MNNENMSEEVREEVERILVELSKTNFDRGSVKVGIFYDNVLAKINELRNEKISDYEINHRLCDCLKCRLGKHDKCQTFRPSKKGKRK